MHAVLVNVQISDEEAARQTLRERVVPMVKQAPGLVGAYWMAPDQGRGYSIAVFESEEAARTMADNVQAPPDAPVTINHVSVAEIIEHA